MFKMNDQFNVNVSPNAMISSAIVLSPHEVELPPPNHSSADSDNDDDSCTTLTRNLANSSEPDELCKSLYNTAVNTMLTHDQRQAFETYKSQNPSLCYFSQGSAFPSQGNISHDSHNSSVHRKTHKRGTARNASCSSGNESVSNYAHNRKLDSPNIRREFPPQKESKKRTVASLDGKFENLIEYLEKKEQRNRDAHNLDQERNQANMEKLQSEISKDIDNASDKTLRATEQLISKVMTEFNGVKDRVTVVEDDQIEMKRELTKLHRAQTNTDNALNHMHERIHKTEKLVDHVDGMTNRIDSKVDGLSRHMSQLTMRVNNCERRVLTMHEPEPELRDDSPVRRRNLFSLRDTLTVEGGNNLHDIHIPEINERAFRPHSRSGSHSSADSVISRKNISNDEFLSKLIGHLQNGSIKFPSYSGDIDIDNYKKQCDVIASQHNWSDQTLATQIVANLKGDARKLLSLMPKGQETDLKTVWLTLSCNSPKNEASERAKNLLNSYRQLKGQSLLKLALEIKRLSSEAYPNTDQATRNELAVDAFTKAVNSSQIRFQLRIAVVKTVDEARVLAEKIESAFTNDRVGNLYHLKEKFHSQPNSEYETDSEQVENSQTVRKRKSVDDFETRNKRNSTVNMINEQKESAKNTLAKSGSNPHLTNHVNSSPSKHTEQYSGLDWQNPRRVNFSIPSDQNSNNFSGNYRYPQNYNYNTYYRGNNWRYRNNRGRRFYNPYFVRNNNYAYPQNSNFQRNSQDMRGDSFNGSREDLNRQGNGRDFNNGERRSPGAAALNEQRQQN
jgi:hypothetical protein